MRSSAGEHGTTELDRSRIKGVAFREFLAWAANERGADQVRKVIAGLSTDQARLFEVDHEYFGVLPATWYPAPVVHALLDGLMDGLSATERDALAREGARHVMTVTLQGIYRRLMSMLMTPQLYARFATKIWQSYYDTGRFAVTITDETTADCTVEDWVAHHPVICAMNAEAANAIYEAMGKKAVRTKRTECVGLGQGRCRFITTWE